MNSSGKLFSKYRKFSNVRFAAGLILAGLFFTVLSAMAIIKPQEPCADINATITEINVVETADNENESHVFVTYNVDGRNYDSELSAYDSRWKVGDVVECRYELANPEIVHSANDNLILAVMLVVGLAVLVFGVLRLIRDIKRPSADYAHYDRVDESGFAPEQISEVENNDESMQEYVFHYTGKLNQSHVMKNRFGESVFRADCGGIKLAGKTDFDFINDKNGETTARRIGHTTTTAIGNNSSLFGNVSSSFDIDGRSCWDFLAERGYGFSFTVKGLKCHYDVRHAGVPVGTIETAGTEVISDKYKGNPLAKIPSAGIYRIQCQPSEAEGFFYICFCLAHTDLTLN